MNVYFHELKAYRKSIVLWSFSIAFLSGIYILVFTRLGNDIKAFQEVLGNLPEVVRKALSIYVDGISNLVGFYSIIFVYIVLCGAIQGMNLGVAILSKETREKTADFLMTKPISRRNVFISKLLAAFTGLVITNAIFLILIFLLSLTVHSDFSMKAFLMINVTLLFVQLMFFALGVLFSVLIGKIKSVISISLSTVFTFFIIGSLGSIIGDQAARYLSPFKYFDTQYIMTYSAYEVSYIVVGLLFIIASIAASYLVYIKKDIHSV